MSADGGQSVSPGPEPRDLTITAEAPTAARDYGGQGADVLLLHGAGRSMEDWRLVAPLLLEAGLRVTAMDFRAHGRSGKAPWLWPAVIDDVNAVVDQLGLVRPVIVGHSLGGMVAALWASTHPDCPLAVNADGHNLPKAPHQFAGLDAEALAAIRDFRAAALGPQPDPLVVQLDAALAELDLFSVYRATRCPLLIVSGRYPNIEELLPPAVAAATAAYLAGVARDLAVLATEIPLVSLASLPGNHSIHLELPREFTNLLLQSLGGAELDPLRAR
jgi:pimeloyl-ACP methyl ester carboxylesterase